MRAFKHFNKSSNAKCPICNTNDDKETVLVGIDGTEEGNIMEAQQIHLECIDLRLTSLPGSSTKILYQRLL